MATGNDLIFASSIKGTMGTWLNAQGSTQGLALPQQLETAAGGARLGELFHSKEGTCGEVNLMELFWKYKGSLNLQGSGSRMTVWSNPLKKHIDPCGDRDARYGCDTFIRSIANPNVPDSHLDGADIRYNDKKQSFDEGWSWPQGVTFQRILRKDLT